MSNKEWEQFFDLLKKVTELPGCPTVMDKMTEVAEQAQEYGDAYDDLAEFTAWNWDRVFD